MSITQYQLNWDSYKTNVCNGFTNLQQNEEFVDMTLAADGHLVRVHKSIFALASPYIKSMLQSTPNEHPIIFLPSVSHEVLNYILTYVYTGEVAVEADKIQSFMRVAKDLHLSGLFDMPAEKVSSQKNMVRLHSDPKEENAISNIENATEENVTDNAILTGSVNAPEPDLTSIEVLDTVVSATQLNESNVKNITTKHALSSDIDLGSDFTPNKEMLNNRVGGLYMTADGYQYKLEIQQEYNKQPESTPIVVEETSDKYLELMQASNVISTAVTPNNCKDDFASFEDEFKNKTRTASFRIDSLRPEAITLQYTMSNRGSLQLILNRYMYCCHHQSHGGQKRRWRCIEYRNKHCPAFIDTDGEIMTSRKFGHAHSFHDEKIRRKMKRDLIFTNLNILLQKQDERNK